MLIDKQLLVSSGQGITASALSSYSVNLSAARDIGKGTQLYAVVIVDVSATVGDAAETLTITVRTSIAEGLATNATDVASSVPILGSALTAGRVPIIIPIPMGVAQQYIGLYYAVSTTFGSGLAVTAFFAMEYQSNL